MLRVSRRILGSDGVLTTLARVIGMVGAFTVCAASAEANFVNTGPVALAGDQPHAFVVGRDDLGRPESSAVLTRLRWDG